MENLAQAFNILTTEGEFIYSLRGNSHKRYMTTIDSKMVRMEDEVYFKRKLVDFVFRMSHELSQPNTFIMGVWDKGTNKALILITKSFDTLAKCSLVENNRGYIYDTETKSIIADTKKATEVTKDIHQLFQLGVEHVLGNTNWRKLSDHKSMLMAAIKTGVISNDLADLVRYIDRLQFVALEQGMGTHSQIFYNEETNN